MALFGFGKKKEEQSKKSCCCCGALEAEKTSDACCSNSADAGNTCCGETVDGICCIKVLGAGCKSCHAQYEYAKKAAAEMGLPIAVEYITDMEKIVAYGVMRMPAIVVNEKVVSMGKVLKTADVVRLLEEVGE